MSSIASLSPTFPPSIVARPWQPALPESAPRFGAAKTPAKKQPGFSSKAWGLFLEHYFPQRKREVVGVYDGDTVSIKGLAKNVRLFGIDAPEMGQKYGQIAKEHLEKLILGKKVRLVSTQKNGQLKTDRYGRPIAILEGTRRRMLFRDTYNVNLQMVHDGFARAYESPELTTDEFRAAEADSRKARRGIWKLDPKGGVSPKAYRESKRK